MRIPKLIIIIFLLLNSLFSSATVYYVSNVGNDALDGKTESTAWRTISKINSQLFSPGDIIMFRKGDTWRETLIVSSSGNSTSPITFSNYGNNSKNPRVIGSNSVDGWTETATGSKIWKSTNTFVDNASGSSPGGIYFETVKGVKWGIHKSSTSLTAEFQWTWSANYIYVYSVVNPSTVYTSVEISQRSFGLDLNNKQYLHFNGIDAFYTKWSGYGFNVDKFNQIELFGLTVENVEIGFIGSPLPYNGIDDIGYGTELAYTNMIFRNCQIHDCGRRSVSLHLYGNGFTVRNMLIEKCVMYNGFHTTGVDISVGSTGYTANIDGLIIRQNLFYDNSSLTVLMFIQNYISKATVDNVYIYSNIFKLPNSYNILMEGVKGTAYIYNNDFYNFGMSQGNAQISVQNNGQDSHAVITNNIFYSTSLISGSTAIETYGGQNTSFVSVSYNLFYNINSTFGKGTNSVTADPKFVSGTDLHLQNGSPAIGAGIFIPTVLFDFDGNVFPNPSTIGAYRGAGSTDIYDTNSTNGLVIYPVPATDNINIICAREDFNPVRLNIINNMGVVVVDKKIEGQFDNNNILNLSINLKPGFYLIKIINDKNKYLISRIIIN
jgi:hypothetical protein